MIAFAHGSFNPDHVAFIGRAQNFRKQWVVQVQFSSGGVVNEQFKTEQEAESRYTEIRQHMLKAQGLSS